MLSSLPKLADRNFILGAFLPTLLFAVIALVLFDDTEPAKAWIEGLAAKDIGQAVFLLLGVWVVGVIILMLNHPLYRFLEGYTYPAWIADRLKRRNIKYLTDTLTEIETLHDRWADEDDAFPPSDLSRYGALRRDIVVWMPSRTSDVLPTRFGNAIKAFEVYPRDVYGADGVTMWLRLSSVVSKSFGDKIEGSRSQIDFLINCCLFSTVISLLGFGRTICSAGWRGVDLYSKNGVLAFISSFELHWLFWGIGGAIAAYGFYRWAVTLVPAWGELVMSAFDCYLPALATQLGFELPKTEEKRRMFWTTLSQQMTYRREPDGILPFNMELWVPQKGPEAEERAKNQEAKVKEVEAECENDEAEKKDAADD
jgi:hypothetical protein